MKHAEQREMSIRYTLRPWYTEFYPGDDSENGAYVTVTADGSYQGIAWLPKVTVRTKDGEVTLDFGQWSGLAEVLQALQPSCDAYKEYKRQYDAKLAAAHAKRAAKKAAKEQQ